MKLLVSGGAGFIGSSFIRTALADHTDWSIVNVDKLTYAGNLENLTEIQQDPRYRFVQADIADAAAIEGSVTPDLDAVVNFAAETHVDRSIEDAHPFLNTNVVGTKVLLDAARRKKVPIFLQVSTDEVYGALGEEGEFTEASPLQPNSPYAASKAAADLLVRSYFVTHKMPVVITRSSNNYGPFQFPEKFIPLFVTNALEDRPLPLYGDGRNVRDWTFVDDNARAIALALIQGRPGEVYNIASRAEKRNLDVAETILRILGKPGSLLRFVQDRPGHDWRYALSNDKIRSLGWTPRVSFEEGLRLTVEWYRTQRGWWERVKSGAYREYYERHYGRRLAGA